MTDGNRDGEWFVLRSRALHGPCMVCHQPLASRRVKARLINIGTPRQTWQYRHATCPPPDAARSTPWHWGDADHTEQHLGTAGECALAGCVAGRAS